MSIYYIKSLKWSGTESYSGKDVYWKDNDRGYTTDINNAGIYTKDKVKNNKERYDNGNTTKAMLIEVGDTSESRYEDLKMEVMDFKLLRELNIQRHREVKEGLKELKILEKRIGELDKDILKGNHKIRIIEELNKVGEEILDDKEKGKEKE